MVHIIISIALAGGGIFLLRSYVQPELAKVQSVRAEQSVVEDAIKNAREVIRLRDDLLSRYNSIDPVAIDKIRKFLPAGSALSELFIDVNTMARQSDIHISAISFSENGPPPPSLPEVGNALTITLGVDGSYVQFLSFLRSLENNLRLVDVVSIDLAQTPKDGDMGFKLILRAYYQERTIL